MEFRVLGQLEVRRGGTTLVLASFKQRCLLALLLMHANHAVSTDRIIDELWPDESDGDRHNALWVQVSKLRAQLEPGREPRADGTVLLTRPPGYLLAVDPQDFDVDRFETMVSEGRGLLDADPAAASVVLGEGLGLWRGRPYEDVLYESFAQDEIRRLEELRLDAVGLRVEADLRRGLSSELVGELQGLVGQHPLREQFTAQLMLALSRSGRQAEALRAYAHLQSHLNEELGLDCSPALSRLEGDILRGEVDRGVPSARGRTGRLAIRGYELRERTSVSALGTTYRAYQASEGREVLVTALAPALADDVAFVGRCQSRTRQLAEIEQRGLVPVYDFWREPEGAFLVSPVVRGRTVDEALADGWLTMHTTVTVVTDVSTALSAAHRRGLVHGSISPRSIVIDDEGRGLLTDFGLAPLDHGDDDDRFVAPERQAGGPPTVLGDVYSLAKVFEHALRGSGFDGSRPPVVIPPGVDEVVARATAADPAIRFADAQQLSDAITRAVDSRAAVGDARVPNPYKGLRAFNEADAEHFFGRERVVERLVARLGTGGSSGRFIAVVGPSGSGKSSVVGAGLLPAVRAGTALPGSVDWLVAQLTPGRHPYEELVSALRSIAVDPPDDLLERMMEDPLGLGRALRGILPDNSSQLLLTIDQFEELFTLAPPPICRAFLETIAAAVQDRQSRLRVVITLRADFYDRPLQHHAFGELLRRGTELVTAMSPDELQRAIEQPAARVGVRFEPGLVASMVADISDHTAELPLLQYALTELFEQRRGDLITLDGYRRLGGAAGALAAQADRVYLGLRPAAREITRQVLLRLVNVGDGDDEVTRRRVLRQELLGLGEGQTEAVLDALGQYRLLVFDRDTVTRGATVEIAHEALFAEWYQLRSWIADCRDEVRRHRRLTGAADEWRAHDEADDYLLHGSKLDEAIAVAAGDQVSLTPPERRFVEAGVARRDAERAAEVARTVRDLRAHRTNRRRNALLAGGAVVLAAAIAFSVIAVVQRRQGDRRDELRGEADRLAGLSADIAGEEPELAMLLALQSLATSARAGQPATPGAVHGLHWGLQAAGVTYPVVDAPVEVHLGPDGPTGIFNLPLPELVGLARQHLTRGFTPAECERQDLSPCPSAADGLASPAATGPAAIPADAADGDTLTAPEADRPFAGTTVTILDSVWGSFKGVDAEVRAFEERTGIQVEMVRPAGPLVVDVIPGQRRRPDLTIGPSAGLLNSLAADGRSVDLSTYLDVADLRARVGDRLVDLATVDSALAWVPLYIGPGGLVWYPSRRFREAGYEIPRTWDELLALSRQMVADGRTPWCFGMNSGPNSGFTATDWVEELVMRTGGVEIYDRWVSHQVPFTDPTIRRAVEMFGTVMFSDGFLANGPASAVRADQQEELNPMFADTPGCWMYLGGSSVATNLPARANVGTEIDYFRLPPVEDGVTAPPLLGGFVAAALSDRPEVRELIQFIASKRWGFVGPSVLDDAFIPPHREMAVAECVSEAASLEVNTVRVRLCQDTRAALASGEWRYDASESMPAAVGALDEDGNRGAFAQALLSYVAGGPDSLDGVLADLDAAWP